MNRCSESRFSLSEHTVRDEHFKMTFKLSSSIFGGDSARAEEVRSARAKGKLCIVAAREGEAHWLSWQNEKRKSSVQCHLMFGEAGRLDVCASGLCKNQHIVEYFKPHIDPITT